MTSHASLDRSQLESVEAAALQTPGVVSLHPGPWGEAGTYLPNGMFPGVRVDGGRVRVHVTVTMSRAVFEVTEDLRERVGALVDGPVDVVVEDIVEADDAEEDEPLRP